MSLHPERSQQFVTMDGNEAAARVAYGASEVIAIYPITPASPMGELADAWASVERPNLWDAVPEVIEMQSEGGAAGVVHGALQAGSLTTTFTASQGLLLMIPNMFKIAGELTPTVFHIAARALATHALSIFGDHSDVMAVRSTGWAMLASSTEQEAQDLALVAHAATLRSRVPFLHFFDGFRTSHETNKIAVLEPETMRSMLDADSIAEHRRRALNPDRPVLRGSAQNPDVFFQAREAANPYYDQVPEVTQQVMDQLARETGRQYRLFEYVGHPEAERVIVLMGSGVGAVEEAVQALVRDGERVGMLKVRLYRPFDGAAFVDQIPETARRIAVLDRTKEPGAIGEPLYQDVVTAFHRHLSPQETRHQGMPLIIGGRYGLGSKEFTPAMVASVFEELGKSDPKSVFTVGIYDDVTDLSLKWDADLIPESDDVTRAVFFGLGSDGTVGATKNTVKIIGESTDRYAQGYYVYDSKKSGSVTTSHVRISDRPIESTYLIRRANFVACHQFNLLAGLNVLETAEPRATFLLNSPHGPDTVWDHLPVEVQEQILDKQLQFYVIDAFQVAWHAGLGGRINTVMQTCFFALSRVLPIDEAIQYIKDSIRESYGKRGASVLQRNFDAVDGALAALHQVELPTLASSTYRRPPALRLESNGSDPTQDFLRRVTLQLSAGQGDLLPVSALPVDGTFPTGTAQFEKRSIARDIPIWDAAICTQCGLCAYVCPHAAIRSKAYAESELRQTPENFPSMAWKNPEHPDWRLTIQVAPDDCTGCGVCVDVCPARSKEVVKHKAINMLPKEEHLERERENYDFFLQLPELDRRMVKQDTVKGSQLLQPLFEYSGACAGCGETPYLKLMSQLFGDRVLVANATGCSSIYGGNLPTTPWSRDDAGRGPAWSNSLFEDNAEFGLGMRLSIDHQYRQVEKQLGSLASQVGDELVKAILQSRQTDEGDIAEQRERLRQLRRRLDQLQPTEEIRSMSELLDVLVKRSVWIVGGDGWAYDIGFGGLDHLLTTGRDVNILVLDTGVYSNTGGQASKATPRGAVAKFSASGKVARKKDLGLLAVSYGNVYVAQIALGANPAQTLRAFREAESYPGPSLLLAYSHCIAHGIAMDTSMSHQKDAVQSGFWPLYRYDPRHAHDGGHPFQLDCRKPTKKFTDFAMQEGRFAMLARSQPEHAAQLFQLAQRDIDDQWHYYEQMAGIEREVSELCEESGS